MLDDSVYAPFAIARREDGTHIELGRGAMGITFKATDTQLGRTVALKVINAAYLGDPIARQRFLAEARAAAQLQHANVASVYHLRAEGDDVFYAMEFVKGETVEAYVKRRGPLPARLALRIIWQAAQGLAAANERGLIHRDIKPANLMLARAPVPAGDGIEHEEEDGLLVKVIDFGLAKSVSGNESGGGLTGGSVVGTPHFMSPEQISLEAGRELDCRSDIYSLGVTLWYLLVGRPPFEGPQFQILSQHLQKRPPLEELSEAGVAMEIVALVGSMLAKDREERPANYPALIAALKKLLRAAGSTTTATEFVSTDSAPGATLILPNRPRNPASSVIPGSESRLENIAPAASGIGSTAGMAPVEGAGAARRWAIPVIFGGVAVAALVLWQPWRRAEKPAAAPVSAQPTLTPSASSATPPAAPVTARADVSPEKSVAVLAFENLSDDKSNEYFSDGVSEELLTVLQKIPGLRVAARTSAFSFKGKNVTAQEIGQQLGVAQLVEGSVRKSGNSVRIAARLSRADTGEQVWSENYTRDLKDVFAVQTEIAQTIVEQLRGQLDAGPRGAAAKAQIHSLVQAAEKGGTKNVEAYQHYLRGRFLSNQFSSEGLAKALVSYRKAVELDPGFALPWAALSETLSLQTGWDSGDQPLKEGFKRAREAVDRALAIEPNLAEALLALGRLQIWHDFDWRGGKASARRALELAPSSAQGLGFLAECEAAVGNVERALELGRQAITLDPLNPEIRLNHGIFLAQRGPYAEAESEFRRALEITPNAIGARANWSTAALLEGRVDEAVTIAEKDSPGWGRFYALSLAYWNQGRKAEADAELRGLEESFAQAAAYQVGEVYAYRGESDKAFAWLDRAYQQRDPGIVYLKLDRLLASLHGDPRWAALLHRAGLGGDESK